MPESYDAVLVLSFGGPEKPDDVIPFLENVLRGKTVPRQRLLEVAEHYYQFDGRSPINDQNRELIEALRTDLKEHGIDLPVYWGNRNWHPFLASTLAEMRSAGVRRALAFVTSAFSSYSGCRQYLDDIERARAELGAGAPIIDKLRGFYNHPGFIATMADRVRAAFAEIPAGRRISAKMIFTAHSIPLAMAAVSPYVSQLEEACRLTAAAVGQSDWTLVFQSRSGSPSQPWLEPDIGDALRRAASERVPDVVVVPIGFVSDHMEVLYDLDTEASALAASLGLNMVRARTVGSHPQFVAMIRELIMETMDGGRPSTSCHTGCCRPESAL